VLFDINVDDSVEVDPYTIPVLLKTNLEAGGQAARFLNLQYFVPSIYNTSGYMLSYSNIPVTVIPKLSGVEFFKEFWDTFGEFISLIGGKFIAGITASVFERMKNRKTGDKSQQRLDNIS
jgi:Na+/H+ antiporter NhaD/arsenite permease-like protein